MLIAVTGAVIPWLEDPEIVNFVLDWSATSDIEDDSNSDGASLSC